MTALSGGRYLYGKVLFSKFRKTLLAVLREKICPGHDNIYTQTLPFEPVRQNLTLRSVQKYFSFTRG